MYDPLGGLVSDESQRVSWQDKWFNLARDRSANATDSPLPFITVTRLTICHASHVTPHRVHLRSDVFTLIQLLLRKRSLQRRLQLLQMVWLLLLHTRSKRMRKVG